MNLIDFNSQNCKNCYKCLRTCHVKAIKIKDDKAEIMEEKCIACGQCLVVCPQEARYIKTDVDKVLNFIKSGEKCVVSLAPSFAGSFEYEEFGQMVTALKNIGFYAVEETAVGAELVSKEYEKYINNNKLKNVITTCCPSSNFLIEKYYPELIKYMIPVVSPMIAHARRIKEKYGSDTKIIFIGPCISKKYEVAYEDETKSIDAVITFEELYKWFKYKEINISDLEESEFDEETSKVGTSYPLLGSVIDRLDIGDKKLKYDYIKVDGFDKCREILEEIKNKNIENVIVELNVCIGGCIGGPATPKEEQGLFVRKKKVSDYVKRKNDKVDNDEKKHYNIGLEKNFQNKAVITNEYSEKQIISVMREMGKFEKTDELNCGACGYNTCREKAKAVLDGMSEKTMCVPYMRSKAESLTNVIFENSPNAIFLLDENLAIKEYNPTAARIFLLSNEGCNPKNILNIISDKNLVKAKENKENVYGEKVAYHQYGIVMQENILYLEKEKIFIIIMNDITLEEKRKKELGVVKEETLDAAQRVIEKQMRVAQEIASLLGETTAETKVILTKLKKMASKDGDI
ncbi:[Fe-Fe] hydrogenase large subunit C-terminal domain-containing protein [Clostridium sp. DL1XJH146]